MTPPGLGEPVLRSPSRSFVIKSVTATVRTVSLLTQWAESHRGGGEGPFDRGGPAIAAWMKAGRHGRPTAPGWAAQDFRRRDEGPGR